MEEGRPPRKVPLGLREGKRKEWHLCGKLDLASAPCYLQNISYVSCVALGIPCLSFCLMFITTLSKRHYCAHFIDEGTKV